MTGNHIEPMNAQQVGDGPKGRGQSPTATRRNWHRSSLRAEVFYEVRTTQAALVRRLYGGGEKDGLQGWLCVRRQ